MATRSLRVAEATSTAMAGRVERAGTTTLVTRWVVTTRMSGCGAWGAIVSLGLIPSAILLNKVNNVVGYYLGSMAMCSVSRRLHLLKWKASQQPERQHTNVTSARCFARISSSPESSDSVRSSHVFAFL
jgi:hypothetical protein